MNNNFPYNDILHLPHHVSPNRARMSMVERAAQFAPFAALTGYDAAIQETARLTGQRVELTEGAKAELDGKIRILSRHALSQPAIAVTHFVADLRKEGGRYVLTQGKLKKVDPYGQYLLLTDGSLICLCDILELDCDLFQD